MSHETGWARLLPLYRRAVMVVPSYPSPGVSVRCVMVGSLRIHEELRLLQFLFTPCSYVIAGSNCDSTVLWHWKAGNTTWYTTTRFRHERKQAAPLWVYFEAQVYSPTRSPCGLGGLTLGWLTGIGVHTA